MVLFRLKLRPFFSCPVIVQKNSSGDKSRTWSPLGMGMIPYRDEPTTGSRGEDSRCFRASAGLTFFPLEIVGQRLILFCFPDLACYTQTYRWRIHERCRLWVAREHTPPKQHVQSSKAMLRRLRPGSRAGGTGFFPRWLIAGAILLDGTEEWRSQRGRCGLVTLAPNKVSGQECFSLSPPTLLLCAGRPWVAVEPVLVINDQ
jgi:hypothetical protein